MNEKNGRCRNPSPYVSVHETLYPYHRRIGMKQYKYNSSKPVKYGLFYRSLSNAKVPYTYSTLPYTGKPEVIGAKDYYVTSCNEYTKWLVNKFQMKAVADREVKSKCWVLNNQYKDVKNQNI